jgi:F0F1-type ATP synthase delta subunit
MPINTLKQAVKEVIRQNESVDYHPARFIEKTENGDAENLPIIIAGYLLSAENKKEILKTLEKYKGRSIFIEEFISMYHFNLPADIIKEAIQRTKEIQEVRFFHCYNKKDLINV